MTLTRMGQVIKEKGKVPMLLGSLALFATGVTGCGKNNTLDGMSNYYQKLPSNVTKSVDKQSTKIHDAVTYQSTGISTGFSGELQQAQILTKLYVSEKDIREQAKEGRILSDKELEQLTNQSIKESLEVINNNLDVWGNLNETQAGIELGQIVGDMPIDIYFGEQ